MPTEIYLASDHGGVRLKAAIHAFLTGDAAPQSGLSVTDLGPDSDASVDYPDYAGRLAAALENRPGARGILICGSGIGISIAANRYPWIRAALVQDETSARLCREHNDANVLALGERTTGELTALAAVAVFLNTEFAGGRHQNRVAKLADPAKVLDATTEK